MLFHLALILQMKYNKQFLKIKNDASHLLFEAHTQVRFASAIMEERIEEKIIMHSFKGKFWHSGAFKSPRSTLA